MNSLVRTVQLEELMDSKIFDARGRVVGRIEEVVAESEGDELLITEFHTGGYGFLERLSAITLGGWFLHLIGRKAEGYIIRWDQLDLSAPDRPVLTCNRSELKQRF